MSGEGLVTYLEVEGKDLDYEWKDDDAETIREGLKKIIEKNTGNPKKNAAAISAIESDKWWDNSGVTTSSTIQGWVDTANEKYEKEIMKELKGKHVADGVQKVIDKLDSKMKVYDKLKSTLEAEKAQRQSVENLKKAELAETEKKQAKYISESEYVIYQSRLKDIRDNAGENELDSLLNDINSNTKLRDKSKNALMGMAQSVRGTIKERTG